VRVEVRPLGGGYIAEVLHRRECLLWVVGMTEADALQELLGKTTDPDVRACVRAELDKRGIDHAS
jgi:hypothetical protein